MSNNITTIHVAKVFWGVPSTMRTSAQSLVAGIQASWGFDELQGQDFSRRLAESYHPKRNIKFQGLKIHVAIPLRLQHAPS